MDRCPLTNCLRCLDERKEGFADYEGCRLMGVFACRCPGENATDLARILKSKGAEAIHFCTCTFAGKNEDGWSLEKEGLCAQIDEIMERVHSRPHWIVPSLGVNYSSQLFELARRFDRDGAHWRHVKRLRSSHRRPMGG